MSGVTRATSRREAWPSTRVQQTPLQGGISGSLEIEPLFQHQSRAVTCTGAGRARLLQERRGPCFPAASWRFGTYASGVGRIPYRVPEILRRYTHPPESNSVRVSELETWHGELRM